MEHKLSLKWRKAILVFVYLAVPFSGLGLDLYAPSLPAIAQALSAPHQMVQLTMTVYLLSFACGQLFVGPITDRLGRRPVVVCGLLTQLLVLLAIIFNHSIHVLLLLRFAQGLSIAALVVPARAMIADMFNGKAFHKYINYMTLCWAAGPIFAPWIGSHLQHAFNWQANFIFMLVYVLIFLVFAIFVLRETQQYQAECLHPRTVIKEYLSMLTNARFSVSFISMGLAFGVFYMYVIMAPFIIQHILVYSALVFGRVTLSLGVMLFLGNLSSRLLMNMSQTVRAQLALGIMLISMLSFTTLVYLFGIRLWVLWIPHLFFVWALGFSVPVQTAQALACFRQRAGLANALFFAGGWGVSALINYIGSWVNPAHTLVYAGFDVMLVLCVLLLYVIFLAPKSSEAT